MSFANYKPKVENGDTVLLYLGYNNMHEINVKIGSIYQTRYGALRHSDLVGVNYGSRIQCKNGYLYVLYPTPEYWTQNLPHRTQILYTTDISMVTMQLDLRPGSVVVESGTGSGSLSHSLIRTIAPTGHLHTFEFHEQRAKVAEEEFKHHGLGDYVTVTHRDVCQEGFQLDHVADAVFLDLPKPWLAIPSAKKALKLQGGRLCSFSPCIEQVQKSCETLTELGFEEVKTIECLLRIFDVKTITMPFPDLGPTPAQQGCHSNKNIKTDNNSGDVTKCSKNEIDTQENEADNVVLGESAEKMVTPEMTDEPISKIAKQENDVASKEENGLKGKTNTRRDSDMIGFKDGSNFYFKAGSPPATNVPGHTGFLTFATLYPS